MHKTRILLLFFALLAAFLAIEGRLLQLQVVEGEQYAAGAERQRLALVPTAVVRGRILSADGLVLAEDRLMRDLAVVIGKLDPDGERAVRDPLRKLFQVVRPDLLHGVDSASCSTHVEADSKGVLRTVAVASARVEIERTDADGNPVLYYRDQSVPFAVPQRIVDSIVRLSALSRVPADTLLGRVLDAALHVARLRTPVLEPVAVIEDVDFELIAAVETEPDEFAGFVILERQERVRPNGPIAPHLVGYTGPLNAADLAAAEEEFGGSMPRSFLVRQRAGRTGIEKSLDTILRGEPGLTSEERDHLGRVQRTLASAPPTPGRDVVLTIDSRLQRAVESALGEVTGAAVFVDVSSGNILAIASFPEFNPDTLRRDYASLAVNPESPLLDRTVAGTYPLGSVFKIVTALASLEKGSTPSSVTCSGSIRYGDRVFHCHRAFGHGTLELTDALRYSCNVFFYTTAMSAGDRALIDMASRLGFGRRTGVQIPNERPGHLPPAAPAGELLNLAIGQGPFTVTPVQVAQMMQAVANEGTLVPLKIVRELRPAGGAPAAEPLPDERPSVRLGLSRRSLDALHFGLYKVVNESGGTASRGFGPQTLPFRVCGKTSTAQRPVRRDGVVVHDNVGWFAGYAPHDRPRIAFVVMVEHLGGSEGGGSTAVPIARRIFDAMPPDLIGAETAREGAAP